MNPKQAVNVLLSASGAPISDVTEWKRSVETAVKAIKISKDFYGFKILRTQAQPIGFLPIESGWTLFKQKVNPPNANAYGDQTVEDNLKAYTKASQAFLKLTADIHTVMEKFLTTDLYQKFRDEDTIYDGYQIVLNDTKNFAEAQLHAELDKIRSAAQGNRTYYEYTVWFHSTLVSLKKLGYPSEANRAQFEKEACESYRAGITNRADASMLDAAFLSANATTFEEMRVIVLEKSSMDARREGRRALVGETSEGLSANHVQLANRRGDRGSASSYVTEPSGVRGQPSRNQNFQRHEFDPARTIVVRNLPMEIRGEDIKKAFGRFGEVTYALKHRSFGSAFVEFKTPSGAAAARRAKLSPINGQTPTISEFRKNGPPPPPQQNTRFELQFIGADDAELSDDNKSRAHYALSFRGIVDSGCNPHHIAPTDDGLESIRVGSKRVTFKTAGDAVIESNGVVGDVSGFTQVPLRFHLRNVLVVPEARETLLSVLAMMKDGYDVWFTNDETGTRTVNIGTLHNKESFEIAAKGSERNGLFELVLDNLADLPHALLAATTPSQPDWETWHSRLMCMSHRNMERTYKSNAVMGFKVHGKVPKDFPHWGCVQGKLQQRPHRRLPRLPDGVPGLEIALDILYLPVPSLGGARYFLGFTILNRRLFRFGYTLKNRTGIRAKLNFVQAHLRRLTGNEVFRWHLDQAGEHTSEEVKLAQQEAGIVLGFTPTQEHQSNGAQEGFFKLILDSWRSHQATTNCNQNLWADGFLQICYIYNRTLHSDDPNEITPFESLYKRKPNIDDLRTFGCLAIPRSLKRNKLQLPGPHIGIFIGMAHFDMHETQLGGYRILMDPKDKNSVIVSRDVFFVENQFDLSNIQPLHSQPQKPDSDSDTDSDSDDEDEGGDGRLNGNEEREDTDSFHTAHERTTPTTSGSRTPSPSTPEPEVVRTYPTRERKAPKRYDAAAGNIANGWSLITVPGPSWREATTMPEWKEAFQTELDKFKGRFELVPPPDGVKVFPSVWVTNVKVDDHDPSIRQLKCRLCLNGSRMQKGVDFDLSTSSNPSHDTFKLLVAISVKRSMVRKHIDWTGAHLYGERDREIYMKQPPGFAEPGKETWVWKMLMKIYGEKDAAHAWDLVRDSAFLDFGFERVPFDAATFVKFYDTPEGRKFIITPIHADDAPVFVDRGLEKEFDKFVQFLTERFQIKVGPLGKQIGYRVRSGPGWCALDMEAYIKELLFRYHENPMEKRSMPWNASLKRDFYDLSPPTAKDQEFMKDKDLRGAAGLLRWIVNARPDIAFTVGRIASIAGRPALWKQVHWKMLQHLCSYLNASKDSVLLFQSEGEHRLSGPVEDLGLQFYGDGDWADDQSDRKSISGNVVILSGAAIIATSKKQTNVADSTAASEISATAAEIKKAVWTRNLLEFLGYTFTGPCVIYCDNETAVRNLEDGVFRPETKYLDIKYLWIRDLVRQGLVQVRYCGTGVNYADVLTKGLGASAHVKSLGPLGIVRGSVVLDLVDGVPIREAMRHEGRYERSGDPEEGTQTGKMVFGD